MNITVNIKLINPEFDEDVARDFFNGEDVEGNFKYLWEDELKWNGDWKEFKILNNQIYTLQCALQENKVSAFSIPATTILRVTSNEGEVHQIVFSKKIVKSLNKSGTDNDVFVEVILKNNYRFVNPFEGAYILESDFPQELLLITPLEDIYGGL